MSAMTTLTTSDTAITDTTDSTRGTGSVAHTTITIITIIITKLQGNSREFTDEFLNSQKEIVKLFQSTLAPGYKEFWNKWTSPQKAAINQVR
jgi:hypothetical protein